jgi:hypothetical protein
VSREQGEVAASDAPEPSERGTTNEANHG